MADENEPNVEPGIEGGSAEAVETVAPADLFDPAAETRQRVMAIYEGTADGTADLRIGQKLRYIRETLDLDMATIAKELKLDATYFMAIERMETGQITSGYLNMYLRAYAKRLGLPEEDTIATYRAECGGVEDVKATSTITKVADMQETPRRWPLYLGSAVAACAAIGVGIALWPNGSSASQNGIVTASGISPVNGARDSLFTGADAGKAAEQSLPLALVAVKQGWIEVRGADGTIFRSRVMAEGETYFPRLDAGWTVSARDGSAFEWRVGDTVIAPLGTEQTAVFALNVDTVAAKALQQTSPAMAASGTATQAR